LEEDFLELDLLERLDSEGLSEFRTYFCFDTDRKKKAVGRKQKGVKKDGGQPLTRKQFVKAIERIVGKWRATVLTIRLLMSYIYGAPCKASNFNVACI
jgi:hypothetical protein